MVLETNEAFIQKRADQIIKNCDENINKNLQINSDDKSILKEGKFGFISKKIELKAKNHTIPETNSDQP